MAIGRPHVVQFETLERLYDEARILVTDIAYDSVQDSGIFRVALAGGVTPLPLYDKLSRTTIFPWNQTEVFQIDERYLTPDCPDSNQFSIKLALGQDVLVEGKEFNFFDTSVDPLDSKEAYIKKLDSLEDPFFDLVILGIGEDGHIASLFPGGDYLNMDSQDLVLVTDGSEKLAGPLRLTLSLPTLMSTKNILVLLAGEKKTPVIEELLSGERPADEFPAKFILTHPHVTIYQSVENMS
jgi:6-phosphogluconolactonase